MFYPVQGNCASHSLFSLGFHNRTLRSSESYTGLRRESPSFGLRNVKDILRDWVNREIEDPDRKTNKRNSDLD